MVQNVDLGNLAEHVKFGQSAPKSDFAILVCKTEWACYGGFSTNDASASLTPKISRFFGSLRA
jgi:hypothetical protein